MENFFLVDTHAHLYASEFEEDRAAMLERALDAGVEKIFLPNIDMSSIPGMLALEAAYPDHCYAMMGLHPCYVKEDYKQVLEQMRAYLEQRSFCAIGEIGLDYYWSKEHIEEQKDAFRIQCRWAKELDLPIVIHARDSLDDIIQIVKEEKTDRLRGIFHCFGGTVEQAQEIVDLDFLMGLGGVLTFKNAKLDRVVKQFKLENFVLETDAPYLTPHPYRGKRNESSYTRLVAEKLAEVFDCTLKEVAEKTTNNALHLFGISKKANSLGV